MFARRVSMFTAQDAQGKALLQLRDAKTQSLPNHWAFFGGGIEEGETPEDAVIREAREELQIELKNPQLFKRYVMQESKGLYEKFVFLCEIPVPLEQLRAQQQEGKGAGFFSKEEIEKMLISENDKTVLREILTRS